MIKVSVSEQILNGCFTHSANTSCCLKIFLFPSTNMFQPLDPILASKTEQRRGQDIYSFPWTEHSMGPPTLSSSLPPFLPPFPGSGKMPRVGVGEREVNGGKMTGDKKRAKNLGEIR